MPGKESEKWIGAFVHGGQNAGDERQEKHRAGGQAEYPMLLHSRQVKEPPHAYLNEASGDTGLGAESAARIFRMAPIGQRRHSIIEKIAPAPRAVTNHHPVFDP